MGIVLKRRRKSPILKELGTADKSAARSEAFDTAKRAHGLLSAESRRDQAGVFVQNAETTALRACGVCRIPDSIRKNRAAVRQGRGGIAREDGVTYLTRYALMSRAYPSPKRKLGYKTINRPNESIYSRYQFVFNVKNPTYLL